MLGNGRVEAMCFDGAKRLCHIRGKLRKKVFHYAKLFLMTQLSVHSVPETLFRIIIFISVHKLKFSFCLTSISLHPGVALIILNVFECLNYQTFIHDFFSCEECEELLTLTPVDSINTINERIYNNHLADM